MDTDQAHRKGHIYRKTNQAWACTGHGGVMEKKGVLLVASCCGLSVEDKPLVSA